MLKTNNQKIITVFNLISTLIVPIWLLGLLPTIMMSDSFSVGNEDPYLSLMMFIWFIIPITIIVSFFLSRKLSSVVISMLPLINLMLFFVLFILGVSAGY